MSYDDTRVATHERRGIERRVTDDAHLPEGRRGLHYRSVPYWKKRARPLGAEVGAYIDAVFDSGGELSKLRDVLAIVTLLEGYSPHRRKDAVERARFFGLYAYQNIKRILVRALDKEPLPTWVDAQSTNDVDRRFARSADQFLATTLPKSDDECH